MDYLLLHTLLNTHFSGCRLCGFYSRLSIDTVNPWTHCHAHIGFNYPRSGAVSRDKNHEEQG